ncbi:MAG: glycosyltransferase family 2 protein [Bdellovibrionaceae bacterium]|nr:glycosyltransferase family 2 protein [Pseudobdellovibrionaceae bacterium]NUM58435.1 glycosyltransferase family 2 protein [Pseudobdellovibrionaceae bacterium]
MNTETFKPGIVILSYNHLEHTRNCLISVRQQLPDAMIYLIHNGTDKKQVSQLKNTFEEKQLQHLIMEKNLGFSGGANWGLKQAFINEKWVLFLTNDTLFEGLNLSQAPPPGFYAPQILLNKSRKMDSLGGEFNPKNGKLQHLRTKSYQLSPGSYFYVPGTAFLIDKETFLNSKGFDIHLGTYWEDVDYSLELQKKNITVSTIPEILLSHKVGKTCHKDPHYTTYLFHRNRLVISWKYCNSLYQRSFLILVIFIDFAKRFWRDVIKNQKWSSLSLYIQALFEGAKMIVRNTQHPQNMSQGQMNQL